MNATSDELALLAAIEASPDDDGLRLAYADCLDEAAGARNEPTPCPRAELIRVQVDRKSIERPVFRKVTGEDESTIPDPLVVRHAELGRRETELISAHASAWRRAAVCGECDGTGDSRRMNVTHTFSRCHACRGDGDSGGLFFKVGYDRENEESGSPLRRYDWRHRVTWHRGFPRVHCTLAECVKEVADHDNNCRSTVPSDWLCAVVAHHRGVEVLPTGCSPYVYRGRYYWSCETWGGGTSDILPNSIFRLIKGGTSSDTESMRGFDSLDAANTALARAISAWCRTFLT